MTYDRARHQELTDILNNGLARVAGPRIVGDSTDTSDDAFTYLLDDVLKVIKRRLDNGCNSAVVDLLFTPANILMAGRLVEALEDRGFYCSEMRRKSEEIQADYLTFEAILLPLKPEAAAVEAPVPAADVAPHVTDTNNTPGGIVRYSVIYVSSPAISTNAIRAEHALKMAGYNVKSSICEEDTRNAYAKAPRVLALPDAPEKQKICSILCSVFGSCADEIALDQPTPYPNHYHVFICD